MTSRRLVPNGRLTTLGSVVVALMLSVVVLIRPLIMSGSSSMIGSCVSKHGIPALGSYGPLELRPGDLPGYTGWVRPAETLAGWFELVVNTAEQPAVAGHYWNLSVKCAHGDACSSSNALFYVRAYGPSIVPGRVVQRRRKRDGVYYDVSIYFPDAGRYTVEVVLTFSNAPAVSEFPLPLERKEPGYEGYLLPGFPRTVDVLPENHDCSSSQSRGGISQLSSDEHYERQAPRRSCEPADLTETSSTSAIEQGRWVVVDKATSRSSLPELADVESRADESVLLDEFKTGFRSLGFETEYVLRDCELPGIAQLQKELLSHPLKSRLHIVFMGDSNFRKQYEPFVELFDSHIDSTWIETMTGLVQRRETIRQELRDLERNATRDTTFMLLFNSGQHDIGRLCSQEFATDRRDVMGVDDAAFSCSQQYRTSLKDLVRTIKAFPAQLKVFQTSTASFLKWGNWGFAWPLDHEQTLPFDHSFADEFNEIARPIMRSAGLRVMDAYWLSLGRPDHREFTTYNGVGQHLAHAGDAVYEVLLREWLVMILDHIKQ